MKRFYVILLLALAAGVLFRQLPEARGSGSFEPFVLIELFTSEGCSSCPPADNLLRDLTNLARDQEPRMFTLGFHVDYWDGLGWPDPFSSAEHTRRQRVYARNLGTHEVYTPQMIVNGVHAFPGFRGDTATALIKDSLSTPADAKLDIRITGRTGKSVTISYTIEGNSAGKTLRVALVERDLASDIRRGENRGRKLTHANVVREFQSIPLNSDKKGQVSVLLPEAVTRQNSSVIAYIQDPDDMRITAAARVDL